MKDTAILAGGCFWGMQDLFRKINGVIQTEVGYIGGLDPNQATYEHVKTGHTGHAEAIKIIFDKSRVSYEDILLFFFKIHDPTEPNKQGNDIGTQYRSEIFYLNEEQKAVAMKVIERVNQSKVWGASVVTGLSPATSFFAAESYHQDYLEKNPNGYTCHFIRKIEF